MTEEPIRPSENPLLVFISSMQDEELHRARTLAIDTVDKYPGMRVWAVEDAPASSESARDRYIRNAGSADLVVWLVGSKTSAPVAVAGASVPAENEKLQADYHAIVTKLLNALRWHDNWQARFRFPVARPPPRDGR